MAERESLKHATQLSEEIKALIRGANFAHLATLMRDGWPQVDPVWMDLEGDSILVCTSEGAARRSRLECDRPAGAQVHGKAISVQGQARRARRARYRGGTGALHRTPVRSQTDVVSPELRQLSP